MLEGTERGPRRRSQPSEVLPLLCVGARSDASTTQFRSEFLVLDPRAAGAVRAFLKIIADDLDLSWQEPLRATVRMHVSAAQAHFIEQIIANNKRTRHPAVARSLVRRSLLRSPTGPEASL